MKWMPDENVKMNSCHKSARGPRWSICLETFPRSFEYLINRFDDEPMAVMLLPGPVYLFDFLAQPSRCPSLLKDSCRGVTDCRWSESKTDWIWSLNNSMQPIPCWWYPKEENSMQPIPFLGQRMWLDKRLFVNEVRARRIWNWSLNDLMQPIPFLYHPKEVNPRWCWIILGC